MPFFHKNISFPQESVYNTLKIKRVYMDFIFNRKVYTAIKEIKKVLVMYNDMVDKIKSISSKDFTDLQEQTIRLMEVELDDMVLVIEKYLEIVYEDAEAKDKILDSYFESLELGILSQKYQRCPIPSYRSLDKMMKFYAEHILDMDTLFNINNYRYDQRAKSSAIYKIVVPLVTRFKLVSTKKDISKDELRAYQEHIVRKIKSHVLLTPFATEENILRLVKEIYKMTYDFDYKDSILDQISLFLLRDYTFKGTGYQSSRLCPDYGKNSLNESMYHFYMDAHSLQ